jgi:hypothetical protein
VTPVLEIDHRLVGSGDVGPITQRLKDTYFAAIYGRNPRYASWCTPVYPEGNGRPRAHAGVPAGMTAADPAK